MDSNYSLVDGSSIKEDELRLIGALVVSAYNARVLEQSAEKISTDSSPLEKHSACLKKAEASRYESEIYRLLSCLYESTANRQRINTFIDAVVDLIDK